MGKRLAIQSTMFVNGRRTAMAIVFAVTQMTVVLACVGFVIAASITLVAGGAAFRALNALNPGES